MVWVLFTRKGYRGLVITNYNNKKRKWGKKDFYREGGKWCCVKKAFTFLCVCLCEGSRKARTIRVINPYGFRCVFQQIIMGALFI